MNCRHYYCSSKNIIFDNNIKKKSSFFVWLSYILTLKDSTSLRNLEDMRAKVVNRVPPNKNHRWTTRFIARSWPSQMIPVSTKNGAMIFAKPSGLPNLRASIIIRTCVNCGKAWNITTGYKAKSGDSDSHRDEHEHSTLALNRRPPG